MVSNAGPPFHAGRAKADDIKSAHRDAVRVRYFRVFIVLVSAPQTWIRSPVPSNGVFPAGCDTAAVANLLQWLISIGDHPISKRAAPSDLEA